MKIEVGVIIYIIDPDSKSVIPARVNEQIVSKKIDGETITHKIEIPNGKTTVLEKLDVKHFTSLDDVRVYLMKRAESVIDQGIDSARQIANDKFLMTASPEVVSSVATEDKEKMQVTLPDGKVANVKFNMPEGFSNEDFGG